MSKRINRTDLEIFFDYDLHLPTRTVYIGPASGNDEGTEHGVNYAMAERAIKGLAVLDATEGDITCVLNTFGGEIENGWAIYDAIKGCKNHVTIKVFGKAMSMGAVILQAADKRLMTENSALMIHYGSISLSGLHAKDLERWSKWYEKDNEKMEQIFLDKIKESAPKFTLSKLKEKMNFDWFLSAQEAVEWNLVDGIISEQGRIIEREEDEDGQ